jgi:putative SOS response-associated peptidase YedK
MCGRYMITSPFQAMIDLFEAEPGEGLGPEVPRLNVSPTQTAPVVASDGEGRTLVPMRWGFLPHWYKAPSDGPLLINARAETIADKPAFRAAVRESRCLVPADGFYEWKGEPGRKRPYVIRARGGGPIAFAGLWRRWGPEGVATFAIVTCPANARLAEVHHRMPVVLAREDWPLWLGEAGKGAAALMRPAPDESLSLEEADEAIRAILARRPAAEATD